MVLTAGPITASASRTDGKTLRRFGFGSPTFDDTSGITERDDYDEYVNGRNAGC
jgi:hypothetical protein